MDANLMRRLNFIGCCLLWWTITAAAFAQEILPDPTRLPTELSAPVSNAIASSGPVIASPVHQLQSVIISSARRAAIINGQLIKLGDPVGDAVLLEVNEGNVVLQNAHGKQVLTLFPGVEIRKKSTLPQVKSAIDPVGKSYVLDKQNKHTVKKKPAKKKKLKRVAKPAKQLVQPKKIEGETK
jgi:MSHA biogenesis protein MshK